MARAECAVPLRNFLGTSYGLDVARSCGRMRIAWVLGACVVVTFGLVAAHFVTKRQEEEYTADPTGKRATVVIPLWLCALPAAFAVYTMASAVGSAESYWRAEELHFNTSEMPKREFLSYRALDDRLKVSTSASLTGTGYIGATALFGPFLRADR